MKKIVTTFIIAILGFSSTNLNAQELPAPSPYAEVMQRVGLTDISMMYSRPGVKGRTIFGDLEPYNQVWRTGANASTKIKFSTDVNIGGVDVEAGTYSVLSVPSENEWKLMLNTDLGVSENSYKAENNVAEISMKAEKNELVETMTFTFANVKDNRTDLVFEWENTKWSVPIEVEVKEQAMENIQEKLDEIEKAYGTYNKIARYYLDNEMELEKALSWAKKSVDIEAKFWNVYTLSLIHEALGNKKEAIEAGERSLSLAEKAAYQPYIKMNRENLEKWSKK